MNCPHQENDNMSITHCQIDRSSGTCTPHEHKSLDDSISKVEASGEDKKHEALLAEFEFWWADHAPDKPQDEAWAEWRALHDAEDAIYTQSQLVTAVAEAVAKERERCAFFIRQSIQQCKEAGEKATAVGKHHFAISMNGMASILQFSLDEILCVFDKPKDTP